MCRCIEMKIQFYQSHIKVILFDFTFTVDTLNLFFGRIRENIGAREWLQMSVGVSRKREEMSRWGGGAHTGTIQQNRENAF